MSLCNTCYSYGIFLCPAPVLSHTECSFYTKDNKKIVIIKIKTAYVICPHVCVLVSSIRDAMMRRRRLAEASWGGDPTETLIRACLARPRLPLLIDIHYLQWLFIPAKYPEEVLVCLCECECERVCVENPDRFVLFVTFSAGEKRGGWLEAWGWRNEQEVSFSLGEGERGGFNSVKNCIH